MIQRETQWQEPEEVPLVLSERARLHDDEASLREERAFVHSKPEMLRGDAEPALSAEALIEKIHPNNSLAYRFSKRAFDIAASIIGLIVLSPVLLIVAIAIKAEDPRGKVLYIAPRGGLHNRPFPCVKLRSMHSNADDVKAQLMGQNEMSGPVFKIKDDPRVTRVGRFIRKTSIDELPQLANVLLGHMSLVGPRPLPTAEADSITGIGKVRELVKPGITCIWQVSGRNDIGIDEWMRMDAQYVSEQSLLLDLKLLFRTIPAVLSSRGAS